jgi:hypothetical protein
MGWWRRRCRALALTRMSGGVWIEMMMRGCGMVLGSRWVMGVRGDRLF